MLSYMLRWLTLMIMAAILVKKSNKQPLEWHYLVLNVLKKQWLTDETLKNIYLS